MEINLISFNKIIKSNKNINLNYFETKNFSIKEFTNK